MAMHLDKRRQQFDKKWMKVMKERSRGRRGK